MHDGDTGPNTGGMGAYCDGRILSDSSERDHGASDPSSDPAHARRRPAIHRISIRRFDDDSARTASVLEFNARLGDPETQVLMHRMQSDFVEALFAAAHGTLEGARISTGGPSPRCASFLLPTAIQARCERAMPSTGSMQVAHGNRFSRRNKTDQQCSDHVGRARAGRHSARRHARSRDSQHVRRSSTNPLRTACTTATDIGQKG